MPFKSLSVAEINEEITQVDSAIKTVSSKIPFRRGLELTGAEVLIFLGSKVVLPIVCGCINRALYDRYKDLQVRSKADEAIKSIASLPSDTKPEPVEVATIKTDLTRMLVTEGLNNEKANEIIEQAIARIMHKLKNKV